jgi:hypothetical protein
VASAAIAVATILQRAQFLRRHFDRMSSKLPKMIFQVGRRDRWMMFVFGIFLFSLILTFHYFWESIPVPLPNGVTWTHAPEGNSGAVEPPPPPPGPPQPDAPPPGQGPDEHSPPSPPDHDHDHEHELDPELAPVPPITDIVPGRPVKPENITVSGLIFYGRKDRVRCMRCYLEVCADSESPTASPGLLAGIRSFRQNELWTRPPSMMQMQKF